MNGYILESKSILESEIWEKPPLYFKVWHYLLLKANHKDTETLKRGQLITSVKEIQDAMTYKVGYRTEKPERREIYRVLSFLEGKKSPTYRSDHECHTETTMIDTTKVTTNGNPTILVTICNYCKYQDPKTYRTEHEGHTRTEHEGHNEEDTNGFPSIYREKRNEGMKGNIGGKTKFSPPTVEEVEDYCMEKGLDLEAESFIDFYASKGWKVGKNSMKDWKAAARNWARRHQEEKKSERWDFMDL